MRSLTTKIGKIIQAFKDGNFFSTLGLIFDSAIQFLRLFLKRSISGDVLFVVGGVGASSMYRGQNVAEELRMQGIDSEVVVQDNFFLVGLAKKFDVFVFHRTLFTPLIADFIEEIKREGKEIIFEADDLLYDVEYLKDIDYLKNINKLERELYEDGIGSQILKDQYVKTCTTTTRFLKKELEKYDKKVFLVKNKINNQELKWAQEILERGVKRKEGDVKIGYFSGTRSHDKDFQVVIPALKKVLGANENVKLCLAGPLEEQSELSEFKGRIEIIPFSSRKENYKNISRVDINLLPLEVGNPFCEAKSELKFFEAGILKVPTVASDTQVLVDAIDDGVDGFVAGSVEG
jgi:glycosyltransferase involved in cell wall biosynthesis